MKVTHVISITVTRLSLERERVAVTKQGKKITARNGELVMQIIKL